MNVTAQITFQKVFGGAGGDAGNFVQQTSDGGYIVAGLIDVWPLPNGLFLIKTDEAGDTLWTKIFSDAVGNCVRQTSDGGFIITGVKNNKVYLLRTDGDGDSLWSKTFGTTNENEGYSVQQTADGGYIISGVKNYNSVNFTGLVYLIKTDSSGNSTWTKTYGGPLESRGYSVQQTTDGGYVIGGFNLSGMGGTYDMYVIKADADGDTAWTKKFPTPDPDKAFCAQQTTDGGYILTGISNLISPEYMSLIKTDSAGNISWNKNIGPNGSSGRFVEQTSDDGYIVTGETGPNDLFLVKTNVDGDTLWTKTFHGTDHEDGRCVQQTIDGGYIIAGNTASPELVGLNSYQVYLIKTDGNGVVTGIDNKVSVSGVEIYPNPASDFTDVKIESKVMDINSVILREVLGNEMNVPLQFNRQSVHLNLYSLSSGMYFLTVSGKDFSQTQKLLIER